VVKWLAECRLATAPRKYSIWGVLRQPARVRLWPKVSREADALANTQDMDACRRTTLPYGNSVRTLQVDMIAFDSADESEGAH
jgi:hypothetical protein